MNRDQALVCNFSRVCPIFWAALADPNWTGDNFANNSCKRTDSFCHVRVRAFRVTVDISSINGGEKMKTKESQSQLDIFGPI